MIVKIDEITSREMRQELPELWNLLNATYHADWRDDFGSARAALTDSLGGYPLEGLRMIHSEVSQVIDLAPTDAQLMRFFEVAGADLWVESELHMSGHQFLRLLADLSRAHRLTLRSWPPNPPPVSLAGFIDNLYLHWRDHYASVQDYLDFYVDGFGQDEVADMLEDYRSLAVDHASDVEIESFLKRANADYYGPAGQRSARVLLEQIGRRLTELADGAVPRHFE